MKYIIWTLRIVLGLLFIFSGIVKANDPMGLVYKMNEIFEVWGAGWLVQYSFSLSVGMIAFEIISGVAMLVGNSFVTWITLMVLINIFYLFLTWYAWTSGNVKECGCFGACIKLSNAETFYKDVALTAISIFLWIYRYRVFPVFQKAIVNISVVGIAAVFAFGFQWWTLHHLPANDCLAYKPGNNLWEKMHAAPGSTPDEYTTILTYEKNGVKKNFTEEEFNKQKIWEDSKWKFVDSKSTLVKEGTGAPEIPHDFAFIGLNDDDFTEDVLTTKGYMFIWFVRDPKKVDEKTLQKVHNIITKAASMHAKFYVAASIGTDMCKTYQEVWGMKDVTFYKMDQVVSKTAMRTDPGLMLLNDGTVVKKWSYLDYPNDIVLDNGKMDFK